MCVAGTLGISKLVLKTIDVKFPEKDTVNKPTENLPFIDRLL